MLGNKQLIVEDRARLQVWGEGGRCSQTSLSLELKPTVYDDILFLEVRYPSEGGGDVAALWVIGYFVSEAEEVLGDAVKGAVGIRKGVFPGPYFGVEDS